MIDDAILRIGKFTTGCMIAVALIIDGLQALLTIAIIGLIFNPIISFCTYLVFFMWFSFKGVKFARGGAVLGAGLLLELIPALNALPAWTLDVVVLLAITWAEDIVKILSPEFIDLLAKISAKADTIKEKLTATARPMTTV